MATLLSPDMLPEDIRNMDFGQASMPHAPEAQTPEVRYDTTTSAPDRPAIPLSPDMLSGNLRGNDSEKSGIEFSFDAFGYTQQVELVRESYADGNLAVIPLNFYETPEMTLIDHEPNGDSATVLVLALAKIHTRTVTKNDDGTFTIVTDDGTFTDTEVMEMLSSFGYRANHAKYTHALAVVARFPPFDHLAYSEAERDKKTPEVYR